MRGAAGLGRELEFELRQRLNVKGRRFVGCYRLKMFAVPPCGRDQFFEAVEPVQAENESSRALGIPTPVIISYMTDNAQSGTVLERVFVQ